MPELRIGDHKILIFQDFLTQVALKRKAFSPICRHLHEQTVRFQLLYLSKLKVIDNCQVAFFDSPEEAANE